MTEERFGEGEWVLPAGTENCGLHLILDGEVSVVIDDEERAVLHAGMYFGELISAAFNLDRQLGP